ncbi:YIP1 family protein [Natronococcus wangiae]|uniref:YIP1 family protein n=1 Tax=Natronococcus wangiae TaxID=3068275 RepID=UPI00273EA942|nr:YIP1 family protein [Natronococcus sp. AD5]
MSRSALRPARLFLRDPAAFFAEHRPAATLPIAVSLVIALAVALVLSILLLGSMLAGTMDATLTMDNPDRPPEWVCEQHGPDSPHWDGCDEPKTVERDAGSLVHEAATDYLGYAAVAPFVVWLLGGLVLFGAARLANGAPSLAGAFALAGWAAVPEFFRLAVGLLAFRYALSDVTIRDPGRGPEVVEAALAPIDPILTVATVLTAAWQWYLLAGGLEQDADLSRGAAAAAVGVPLAIWLLVGLA